MTTLPFTLDRSVVIRATPDIVFSFFTDTPRWARWWGPGSSIDPTPGGKVVIRYPTGDEALGEVLEIKAPERIVFSYGYARGTPIAPGGSRVTIRLEAVATGTRLTLAHAVHDAAVRDEHVQGWRFQLALFAMPLATWCTATRQPLSMSGSGSGRSPMQRRARRGFARSSRLRSPSAINSA